MDMSFLERNKNTIFIFFAAFLLRIVLSFFGTLNLDQGTFIAWSNILVDGGFKSFYNSWSDYLPGYLYILWFLGKINFLNILPEVVVYKLPAIFCDIATGFLIYKILSGYKSQKWGIIGAGIYVFNPAILSNSTLWGQADSLTAFFSILSVYFLDKKYLWSAVFLSLGTLIKPQAAFILPIMFFLLLRNKNGIRRLVNYCFVGLIIFILAFIPFSNGNLIYFILNRIDISSNQYPFTSVNAFNFWGLFGFWKPDNVFFQFGGYFFVLMITLLLFFRLTRNKFLPYHLTALIFAASFMFFTRMHERHLLPLFAPLAVVAVENPLFLIPYLGFSITYLANMVYSYQWITYDFKEIFPEMFSKFLIVINLGILALMHYLLVSGKRLKWSKFISLINRFFAGVSKPVRTPNNFPKLKFSSRKKKIALIIILAFALVTRIAGLGHPEEMYFDEVYHAFTAKIMMGTEAEKAWEWWNTPPEGFAYEWTHPPFAKLGMVAGMSIFGQNSFGWRIPGAMLGFLSVFLIYLLAKKLFNDEVIGIVSAAIFSLDGLSLVLNRIGMNDSYLLFFLLLSIYFFMGKRNFLSALFYGFALASKWSAFWAIPVFFILWLKRGNKLDFSLFWFLILPPVIYFLSYLPMFTTGHDLTIWWGMQKQMWWYHTNLRATHPYTSPWWTWPLMIRPIYLYTSGEIGGMVSRIYALGNPFVFWFGMFSVIICAIVSFVERNKKLGLLVFFYLIFFVPWAASPRIMFVYHYLPSVPFISIAISYVLRRNPKIMLISLSVFFLAFLYFYPHWTAINIPLWLDRSYYWVESWR